MESRNRFEQHDTVVLSSQGRQAAGAPGADGQDAGPGGEGHDAGQGPWTWPAPGWQSVSDWRAAALAHRSTAWSQVPPFIPSAGPSVVVLRNNAAVVGASLGSVALFLSLLPVIGIVAWVIAPIGLVSSVAGLLVGVSRRAGRVGALWGLLTSGLALVVCLAWTALVLAL